MDMLQELTHFLTKSRTMKRFIQLISFSSAMLATVLTNAQANYWNLSGTYFNTVTGAVSSTPTNVTDVYPDAFAVPGLCNTYYRVAWSNVHGTPPFNELIITDISSNTTGHPFNASGDQYHLVNDGYLHQGASVAVAPLSSDGTRKIYAVGDYDAIAWTVNADGTVSGPTTVYSFSPGGGYPFDSRNPAEVSADGQYLLAASGNSIYTIELATGTLTTYPAPLTGATISGYEYVTGWSSTPRLYLSYNNTWGNPLGTGGFGYYDIGGSTFNAVTTAPSGKTMLGFGFTEIEKAKNGNLYLAYNTGSLYSATLNTAGTLYSYSSAGSWSSVSGVSITAGMNSNWAYAIQTQIDGEDYDASDYSAPLVTSATLNGTAGGGSASSAPTIFRCPNGILVLDATFSGLVYSKTINITLGTISGGAFTPTFLPVSYPISNSETQLQLNLSDVSSTIGSYVGAYKIEITTAGPCSNNSSTTYYFDVKDASALVDFMFSGIGGVAVSRLGTPALGASSLGIMNYVNTTLGTGAITSYSIDISGPSGNLGSVTSSTPMTGVYNFNAVTNGYFVSNYYSYIGSNPTFSVVYTINTEVCGKFWQSATFRIDPTKQYQRQVHIRNESGDVRLSPNPAENQFFIEWYETEESKGTATLYLTDMMGRFVAHSAWGTVTGNNRQTVDMSNLPAGIYHYQFRSGAQEKTGSLTKK